MPGFIEFNDTVCETVDQLISKNSPLMKWNWRKISNFIEVEVYHRRCHGCEIV